MPLDGVVIPEPMARSFVVLLDRIAKVNETLDRIEKTLDESDRSNGRTSAALCGRGG